MLYKKFNTKIDSFYSQYNNKISKFYILQKKTHNKKQICQNLNKTNINSIII